MRDINSYKIFNYNTKRLLNGLNCNRLYFIFILFYKMFKYKIFFNNSSYNKYNNNFLSLILKKFNILNSVAYVKKLNIKGRNSHIKNNNIFLFTNLFDDFNNLFLFLENKENINKIYYKNGMWKNRLMNIKENNLTVFLNFFNYKYLNNYHLKIISNKFKKLILNIIKFFNIINFLSNKFIYALFYILIFLKKQN